MAVMVSVGAPYELSGGAQRLGTVRYQRPVPHIKHVGSFAQAHYGRPAKTHRYHDALLTDAERADIEATRAQVIADPSAWIKPPKD